MPRGLEGKEKRKMRIVTINLPEETLDFIDMLVKKAGLAPSRSEMIRKCVQESMSKLFEMYRERQAIISEIKTSENYLTPNDIIFVRDARNGKGYTKYKVVGEA